MKYPNLTELELIPLKNKRGFTILKFKCCDCGLIHDMAFAIEKNGNLGIALRRNNRSTALARRKKQIKK